MRRLFFRFSGSVFFISAFAAALAYRSDVVDAQTVTCNLTTACGVYQNTSSGPALHGQGTSGYGIRGNSTSATGVVGSSASGSLLMPGVEGESTNASGGDAGGGFGLTLLSSGGTGPAYGAIGYGSVYGLYGATSNAGMNPTTIGVGVFGTDNSSGSATDDYNAGVLGKSTYGIGVLAEANGTPSAVSYSQDPIGLYAVGNSYSYTAGGNKRTAPGIGILTESTAYPLYVANTADNSIAYLAQTGYLMNLSRASTMVQIDDAGNFSTTGTVTTRKGTYTRTAASSGRTLISYGGRTASPEIDDAGRGQLVDGRSFVRIDGDFADVIDARSPYLVFLTADGDCNGLYVASTGPAGFSVREMRGGRSTIAFQYRIVAKPIDEDGRRLAVAPAFEKAPTLSKGIGIAQPSPQTPEERLKEKLGPQRYARTLSNFRRLQINTR